MNLIEWVRRLRAAIRLHREQYGDDRCWLDDWRLWKVLPDTRLNDTVLPADAMERCRAYYANRRADAADPTPPDAVLDPSRWDADLESITMYGVLRELTQLVNAIRAHRDIKDRERTVDDDRALYAALPEKIPADFRLPPEDEFLGEARAPHAGCPAFLRSHGSCPSLCHDLHNWGPCAG